jgi:Methyltransferase FkbM domain
MHHMRYYDIGIASEDEVIDGIRYMSLETSLRTHELRKGSRKILKLDVEGAEYTTLPTAMGMITEFDHILMEVHWMDPKNET